jgi:hypothetical protein
MTLLGFGLNINPNSKVNIVGSLIEINFRFLVLICFLPISRFFSENFELFFGVVPIILNICQDLYTDVIIFLNNDLPDIRDVLLAPSYLRVVILRLSFT